MPLQNTLRLFAALVIGCAFNTAGAQSGDPLDEYLPGGIYDVTAPEWRGQSGMTFLQIGGSARAEGMGGAYAGGMNDPGVVYYNPAGLASVTGTRVYVNRADWLIDMTVNDLVVSTTLGFLTVAATYHGMDYGTIDATVIEDGSPGFRRLDVPLEPTAWAAGIGVGMQMTDRFAAGVHIKYVKQDFGTSYFYDAAIPGYNGKKSVNKAGTYLVDLGTQYNTGLRGIQINMAFQQFGQSQTYVERSFQLPLTYRVGFSFDAIEVITGEQSPSSKLTTYIDGVDRRDVNVDAAMGMEYSIAVPGMSLGSDPVNIALRFGRRAALNQDGWLSAGAGAELPLGTQTVTVDYAYNDYGPHFTTQHVSFGFSF